jgi:hypothetical protein
MSRYHEDSEEARILMQRKQKQDELNKINIEKPLIIIGWLFTFFFLWICFH